MSRHTTSPYPAGSPPSHPTQVHEYLYGPTAELELTSLAHSSSYLIWVNHLSLQTLVYVGLFTLFHSQSQLQQLTPHDN